ncbi:MAG: sigma 54-interacting transcriptional regulator [Acidobacteria bacterium]|nr:sigma 54-interacting transcriptional regulator [Acidobacteriota bacterium]
MQTEPTLREVVLPPRYQLQAVLKESPTNSVYRVFDAVSKRDAAIKILRQEISGSQAILGFRTEFETLAALSHPNIVQVFDFGLLDDRFPYFTMEYFPGRRVTEFFDGHNWEALYHIVLQIASALHHVHHLGIVHLDLKPSNILVDSEGHLKIMDFGVAVSSRQYFDRKIRGTLHYMAPEVLLQDRVDGRADQYALGMTLYETITGALPTYGKPPIEIIRSHLEDEIRRPSAINPHVPEKLERIVLRLLEKDPRYRYPSAAVLLHDVADAAGVKVPWRELENSAELHRAPLIGREAEVREVMRLVTEAQQGRGDGLIIAGTEGMGKGSIIREVSLRTQLEGARVFTGRCPVNRKTIYAPFFEIFQQMLTAVNPNADPAIEIRQMLHPIIEPGHEAVDEQGQKYRLYNRLVQSMQDFHGFLNAGSARPLLVLIVEDLQWADPSTAELFTFLVGEARSSGLVVIGTLTTERSAETTLEETVSRSTAAWEERARDHAIRILYLKPLSEEMVRENVEALLGDPNLTHEFVRWVMWESGGSPLNIRRVVDYLIAHDYLRSTGKGWEIDMDRIQTLRIPGGAGAIWSERLESITEDQREVLRSASVLGEQFDVELLTKVSEHPPEDTFRLVMELVELGLLDEMPNDAGFRFPQVSLRESIYGATSERSRSITHTRAGEYLESLYLAGASELIGQVAYHFARGTEPERAIDYSIKAAEQAAIALAYEQSAEFYRTALELMDISGDEERKPEVRERLGDAYFRCNNLRGAMQVYQFLLKSVQVNREAPDGDLGSAEIMKKIGKVLARRSEWSPALSYFQNAMQTFQRHARPLDVAEMLNRMAWIHIDKGDFSEAERSGLEAIRILQPLPLAPAHGYTRNILGVISSARGDLVPAEKLFQEALLNAETLGSAQLRKVTANNLANILYRLGRWDDSLQLHRRNLEQSENEGDLWDVVTAYNAIAVTQFAKGEFKPAAALLERSIRIGQKLGASDLEAFAHERLGECFEMLGEWKEARAQLERCLSLPGFDENRPNRVSVYVPYARLLARTGDTAGAIKYAQRAYEASERTRDKDLMAAASLLLGQIEQERENFADAERLLGEARELFREASNLRGEAISLVVAGKRALREQKNDDAATYASEAASLAQKLGDRFTEAHAHVLAGKVLFLRGEREAGEARFSLAHAIFEELETPFELGRLLFEVGVLREDPDDAGQVLRRAIKIFEKLDATPDLERARGAHFRIRPSGRGADSSVVGLYEVVKIINSTLSVEEVLNKVLDIALRRLRAERGMIMLIDPITGSLRTRVSRNIREGAENEKGRSPQAIIKEVMQSGASVMSADARTDDRFVDSETVISENIVSTLCVPLVIRDRIAGAIYVDHRETRHLFSQKDLSFLEAFADQSAIAIENARLYEELEQARLRLSAENESLRNDVLVDKHLDSIVGSSEAVGRIQFTVRKAATASSTVLIRGESGTGKGLAARIIHNISPRRNGPFIKFNCAALPENLAESELFGHEKGSFTGADRRKLGRFELANGGSIFLDEIGKMSFAMQAKLLRVVEDKEFERVGGTVTIKTDVKIIAATNLDIEKAIDNGSFREDLFYRLNIIPIQLPALRERKDDIESLAEHFVKKICRDLGVDPKSLEPGIIELFKTYHWPGNIRELEATLHRAIVMATGDVLRRADFFGLLGHQPQGAQPDLPSDALPREVLSPMIRRMSVTAELYDDVLARVDRQLILQVLDDTGGKIRETARRLGLARNTLKAKMQKYAIHAAGGEAD